MYLKLETFHNNQAHTKKKKFKNVREQKKVFSLFFICTIYGRINRSFLMFYDKTLCFLMNSKKNI